jgi:sugar/nucleoside kinase (ribokinase family)
MFDVITIGTATYDVFLQSGDFILRKDGNFKTGRAICLPAGSKIEVPEIAFTTGGGATNTAVTFARQGLKTACVAKIGNDITGKEITLQLAEAGVDTRFIKKSMEFPTAYATLIMSALGERTVLVHRGAGEHLAQRDIPWNLLNTEWFYVVPGNALKTAEKALRFAKSRGIRVALNPSKPMLVKGGKYFQKILQYVDVLLLNREEGSLVTGIPYGKPEKIFKKIDEWVACLAVLTDGHQGVMVSDGSRIYKAGVYKEKKIASTTGAGDAFGSGFVAGLIQALKKRPPRVGLRGERGQVCDLYPREAVEHAIRMGSANATSVVEHVGAKEGILFKRDFSDPRWKYLEIKSKPLQT